MFVVLEACWEVVWRVEGKRERRACAETVLPVRRDLPASLARTLLTTSLGLQLYRYEANVIIVHAHEMESCRTRLRRLGLINFCQLLRLISNLPTKLSTQLPPSLHNVRLLSNV
jgi:hypothetical protein